MDFYEKKQNVLKIINAFAIGNKHTKEQIAFFVLKETGFGKAFVFNYIEESILNGLLLTDKKTGVVFVA